MGIRVWGDWVSRTNSVHWMLHELDLAYERRLIGSRTGETHTVEFLELNPAGKIPVLEDGDVVLTESAAIVTYLGSRYGAGRFVPVDVVERAHYDQWCFFAMTELDAQTLYIIHKHTTLAHEYGEAPVAVEVAKATFDKQIQKLDRAFADGRDWILGAGFSAADILLAYCVDWGAGYERTLPERVDAFLTRAHARPAFANAAAAAKRPSGGG